MSIASSRSPNPVPTLPPNRSSPVVVVADQQRSEPRARAVGIGPAQHDELLLVHALELRPVLRAPVRVGSRGRLRDQALPTLLAGGAERDLALLVQVLGETDRVRRRRSRGAGPTSARAAARPKGRSRRTRSGRTGRRPPARPRPAVRWASRSASAPAGVENEVTSPWKATISPSAIIGAASCPQDRLDEIGIVGRAVLLVPRDQPHGRAPPPQQRALAVELSLEHPRGVREGALRQGGQHRRHEGRHRATLEAGAGRMHRGPRGWGSCG